MSERTDPRGSTAWHKPETIQGRYVALIDPIMNDRGDQIRPKIWDVTRSTYPSRQKLFACRWRYINGRLICR